MHKMSILHVVVSNLILINFFFCSGPRVVVLCYEYRMLRVFTQSLYYNLERVVNSSLETATLKGVTYAYCKCLSQSHLPARIFSTTLSESNVK